MSPGDLKLVHSQSEEKRRADWTTLAFMPEKKAAHPERLTRARSPALAPEKTKAPPSKEREAHVESPCGVEAGED
jgi:hypothetical protein